MNEFLNYWNAITFAFEKYNDLKRDNHIPFIVHQIRITSILRGYDYNEFEHEDLMISALLHDLIEDTKLNLEEIENRFGKKVASIVYELTQPKDIDKDQWLRNFENHSKEAKIIKIADRIDNLLDMENWSVNRQISYLKQSTIIVESCGDANQKLANKLDYLIYDLLEKVEWVYDEKFEPIESEDI